ncbi:MAG: DUF423 domain-containing protein [Weeksellaceae bacterium]|nr:DUF423 domain-containing protein [Weeksellaceae bacterium]
MTLLFGSFYGASSVILGAFGAHAFKKILSVEKLQSFETGVKYQMYHALLLVAIGLFLRFKTKWEKGAAWAFIIGVFLFSFSIYLLSFADYWEINFSVLGPVTPLGGLFMVIGWFLLLIYFAQKNQK